MVASESIILECKELERSITNTITFSSNMAFIELKSFLK